MRIAIWHNLPSGGGKRALFSHVKLLQERGHYLEAWTTDMSSDSYLPLTDIINEQRLPVKTEFNLTYDLTDPIKRIKKQISIMQEHCKTCVKEIESQSFDLIFANSCIFSYMSYISNFSTIPVIIYLGEPYRPLFEALPENIWQAQPGDFKIKNFRRALYDYRSIYSKRIMLREEINAAKNYNGILVNSLFSRESIIRAYGIDAKVCYLGIDNEVFNINEFKKEPYVVGLGKISYIKSVHKAIKVISKIPPETRPVLKWISNGYDEFYFDEVKALAMELGVQFKPLINISDEELKEVLACAAIMIYIPVLEPFGFAPLEANACGTYVIATAEGGVKESISNGMNGHLINGFDEQEMSGVITEFVTDLDKARLKGLEALAFVRDNWSMQKMADNIERIISEMKDLHSVKLS